ncbi:MAG: aminopeptidase, partial [Desulfovibrionaceae bacterium]|nr:aminopeptidase [Desulfovibrionaceae bacterium]
MIVVDNQDLENYAEVLFWALNESRREPLEKGDIVAVRFDLPGVPLAEALYAKLLDAHMRPVMVARPTAAMENELYRNASFAQLMFQDPGQEELLRRASAVATILAPEHLFHLQGVDPRNMDEAGQARRPLDQSLERRRRSGALGWTVCLYPTEALAAASGMSPEEYADRVMRACYLRMPEPIRQWRNLKRELGEICAWLDGLKATGFHVRSSRVDLTVEPGRNRRFVGFTGRNIPACEVYVSPDWRGVRGVYFADQPCLCMGRLVQGVRLEFHDGVALSVEAARGSGFFLSRLSSDGGARRVGEFSLTVRRLSLVDRFMAHTLLDENLGGESGSCHIALGAALPESFSGPAEILTPEMGAQLGFNASAMHWDLVNTEPKSVTAALA